MYFQFNTQQGVSQNEFTDSKRRFEKHKILQEIDNKPEIMYGINQLNFETKNWSKNDFIQANQKITNQLQSKQNNECLEQVQKDIKEFYNYVKDIILDTDMVNMAQMSQHYLTKQGKLVRPTLHLLLGSMLYNMKKSDQEFQISQEYKSQKIWAGVIELLHISSLIHDDIIDNADKRRGIASSFKLYGKRNSTFSANFLIGRAGRKIAQLGNLHMFQIYSEIMVDLTKGEYIQAQQGRSYNQDHLTELINNYMSKTYYKTAALMANSLRGVEILSSQDGKDISINQEMCFKFGQNIGIAFQLVDDILDFTQDEQQLGKKNLADLREGNVTGPILFLLKEVYGTEVYHYLKNIIEKSEISDQEVNNVARILKQHSGIEKTQYLALIHIQRALYFLDQMVSSESGENLQYQALKSIALKIIQRTN